MENKRKTHIEVTKAIYNEGENGFTKAKIVTGKNQKSKLVAGEGAVQCRVL
jgi:hypothetical protein